jgi:hypothetical protein
MPLEHASMPHRSAASPSECSLRVDAAPDLTTKGRDALTAERRGHSCVELLRPRNTASRFSLHSEYSARGSACLIDRTSGRPAATPAGSPSVSFPLSISVSLCAISVHRLRQMRLRKSEWKVHCFQCLIEHQNENLRVRVLDPFLEPIFIKGLRLCFWW